MSWSLTCFSFARTRLEMVIRLSQKPPFLPFPQICVKPKKSKVSGFPRSWAARLLAANRPNSINRVLSGCSSRVNFVNLSRSSLTNCLASPSYWNPTMKSSANLTTTTSPRARRPLH